MFDNFQVAERTRNQFVPKAHEGSNPSLCAKKTGGRFFDHLSFWHRGRARSHARKARRGLRIRANARICVARRSWLEFMQKRNNYRKYPPSSISLPGGRKIDHRFFVQKDVVDFSTTCLFGAEGGHEASLAKRDEGFAYRWQRALGYLIHHNPRTGLAQMH